MARFCHLSNDSWDTLASLHGPFWKERQGQEAILAAAPGAEVGTVNAATSKSKAVAARGDHSSPTAFSRPITGPGANSPAAAARLSVAGSPFWVSAVLLAVDLEGIEGKLTGVVVVATSASQ